MFVLQSTVGAAQQTFEFNAYASCVWVRRTDKFRGKVIKSVQYRISTKVARAKWKELVRNGFMRTK